MERKRRISAPFLRTGLNNYRQSKTAAQPENTIIALIQAGIADNIFSPIILWCPDAGRDDSRVVVLSHLVVDGVEFLIVPVVVVDHCSRGIIRHQNTGYTTEVLIHVNVCPYGIIRTNGRTQCFQGFQRLSLPIQFLFQP